MAFEDELAAAMLAKLAATELNFIDHNTTQQSSAGRANKLDPVSFVTSLKAKKEESDKSRQQVLIDQMNREAELAHPLPVQTAIPAYPQPVENINASSGGRELVDNSTSKDIVDKLTAIVEEFRVLNTTLKSFITTFNKQ
jgi:hypothetical protein